MKNNIKRFLHPLLIYLCTKGGFTFLCTRLRLKTDKNCMLDKLFALIPNNHSNLRRM